MSLQRSKQLEAKIAINMMLDVCSDKFICQSPNSAEIHSIHPFHLDFLNTVAAATTATAAAAAAAKHQSSHKFGLHNPWFSFSFWGVAQTKLKEGGTAKQ